MARHESVKGPPVITMAEGKRDGKVDDNHSGEHEHDTDEPRGSWVGLLAGLLIGGLAGALSGGLVGAVAMLLLAPQSGKRTRAKLQWKSHDLREQTAETMEDAVAQARVEVRQIAHDVRKQADELEQRVAVLLDGQKGR